MSTEADKVVAKRLEDEKQRLENYNIQDGFAFYKGSPVDYTQIKLKFEARVKQLMAKEDLKLIKGEDVRDDQDLEVKTKKTIIEGTATTTGKGIGVEKEKDNSITEEDREDEGGERALETTAATTTTTSVKKTFTTSTTILKVLQDTKSIAGFISSIESAPAKIGIFLNLNGTSKTRKNLIFLGKKAFTVNELTQALLLEDKTRGEKERTDRTKITVERIQACYAEETKLFLDKNFFLTKFSKLKSYGFTKSFYCADVINDRRLVKSVYSELLLFVKTWVGPGNPKRFAEKMKKYYTTVLSSHADVFEEVEVEFAMRGISF